MTRKQEREAAADKAEAPGTFTQEQLDAAFTSVQNAEHWKLPVDAVIQDSERDLVRAAIIHFTGSVPTFKRVSTGGLLVRAAGYYRTIGA